LKLRRNQGILNEKIIKMRRTSEEKRIENNGKKFMKEMKRKSY
jgi:hypothetical protein